MAIDCGGVALLTLRVWGVRGLGGGPPSYGLAVGQDSCSLGSLGAAGAGVGSQ